MPPLGPNGHQQPHRPLPRRNRIVFATILIVVSLTISLAGMEIFLRLRTRAILHSDRMPAGMFQYDSQLGWRLSPGWQGRHRHHDFEARYSINHFGFRNDSPWNEQKGAPIIAVLGDSFTFGLLPEKVDQRDRCSVSTMICWAVVSTVPSRGIQCAPSQAAANRSTARVPPGWRVSS